MSTHAAPVLASAVAFAAGAAGPARPGPAWAVVGDPGHDPGGLFGGGAAPTAIPGPAALGLLAARRRRR